VKTLYMIQYKLKKEPHKGVKPLWRIYTRENKKSLTNYKEALKVLKNIRKTYNDKEEVIFRLVKIVEIPLKV